MVEAVDRLDQPQARHLHEIVQRLTSAAVAARQLAGEREVAGDQLLAGALFAALVPALEQLNVFDLVPVQGLLRI